MEIQKHLASQLPVQTEWSKLTNGFILDIDKEIAEAFVGQKLNLVSPVTFKQTLAYIFTLIGLTKFPDSNELILLEDYIRGTYPYYTIEELRIAFKMAVQGKLECSVEHYEKFSPKFISQIMNAYKAKANEVRKMMKPKEDENIPQLTENEIVEFTRNEWMNGKKDDFNKVFNADRVFNILLKNKSLNFTEQEMLQIIQIVREDNIERLNKMSHLNAKEFSKQIKDPDYVDLQCKKLALVKYFEGLSN